MAVTFRAMAFDYDETLAAHGAISASTEAALAAAREAGWKLVLATGRPHEELLEVCPRVAMFDLVIDENGAVLYVPGQGVVEELAERPDGRLREEMRRLGLPVTAGRIVTLTQQPHQREVREIIRRHNLALDVFCNRYAVMVVPRGTSKASGLRTGLARLGVAPEETIAFGDDENDLTLFSVAGLRVAVGNAIDSVKAAADIVLARPNGEGITEFIRDRVLAAPDTLVRNR
jgi:hydroxymethylpyrimidine pyrophosphatase-like HAD family hydrolase